MNKLTIRQKLIGCRKMLDLTQDDLAKVINVTRTTYHKKEKNPKLFTLDETNIIQNYFNEKIDNAPDIFF